MISLLDPGRRRQAIFSVKTCKQETTVDFHQRFSLTDVALAKTTRQSTTGHGGVSGRAVDGNTASRYQSGSCTHTANNDASPWWEVDLGQPYTVMGVQITNRGDITNPLALQTFPCVLEWIFKFRITPSHVDYVQERHEAAGNQGNGIWHAIS